MFTLQELNSELTTDPQKIGYATPLAATNDNAVAVLINAITGPGAATITIPSLTHDELATLIAPVVMAIGSASSALQAQWNPMLALISGIYRQCRRITKQRICHFSHRNCCYSRHRH
ncbi:hypothetical protein [Ferrovum sp.]|uniref:hypothetical protein n=1 Tax=Ferrovum sp. TaxID=2609467 RepID=UPI002634AD5E|nr:hypothetical protein [Ferrovum sp.]